MEGVLAGLNGTIFCFGQVRLPYAVDAATSQGVVNSTAHTTETCQLGGRVLDMCRRCCVKGTGWPQWHKLQPSQLPSSPSATADGHWLDLRRGTGGTAESSHRCLPLCPAPPSALNSVRCDCRRLPAGPIWQPHGAQQCARHSIIPRALHGPVHSRLSAPSLQKGIGWPYWKSHYAQLCAHHGISPRAGHRSAHSVTAYPCCRLALA